MKQVICKRIKEIEGLYKGYNKTEVYKDGKLYAIFPASQKQPRFGSVTIMINCFNYRAKWER